VAIGIEDLAYRINELARQTLERDGAHALMCFFRTPDGRVEPALIGAPTREEMPAALSRITGEVAERDADGVVVVGEAWRAPIADVAAGGVAESLSAQDILFVAALDSAGNEVLLETVVQRSDDDCVVLEETERTTSRSVFLNGAQSLWGLETFER
jgi:hypothetical protein